MTMLPTAAPLLSALAALAAVLGLIWGAQRVARLRGLAPSRGEGRRLSVAETLPVDARRRVLLIACDGRGVLVLTGGPADVVLGWLPEGGR